MVTKDIEEKVGRRFLKSITDHESDREPGMVRSLSYRDVQRFEQVKQLKFKFRGLGLTQQQVSRVLGISHGYLNRILNGYDELKPEMKTKLEGLINVIESKNIWG
jgi:hypothetical protein